MKKIILSILLYFVTIAVYSQAILPTSWSFQDPNLPTGWAESGTIFYTGSGNTPPAAKFDNTGDYLVINFNSSPGDLTYYLTANVGSNPWSGTFSVEESDLGSIWTPLNTHTSPPLVTYTMFTDVPQPTTRFIRFIFTNKVSGNIGLDDVSIAVGVATAAQEINIKAGGISIVSGDTYIANSPVSTTNPITFLIENLGTFDTLNISSATVSGTNLADFVVVSTFPAYVLATDSTILELNFTPSAAGTRTAILTIESNDTDEPNYIINLYGIGGALASEPISQATDLLFSNVKTYSLEASFTPATSADGYLVLRKKGSAISATPVDGIIYQRGDVIGDAQVVFSSSATSLSPNNIIAGTDYHFSVFSYNGPIGYRNYLTGMYLSGNVSTPQSMLPTTYYSALNTASASFMNDLHALVNPHDAEYYSYYGNIMIPFFETRDTTLDRRVVTCVYSGENKIYNEPFSWTSTGYSREHTYCHSWMPTNPATGLPEYSDFHHLFPTNLNSANILRSNNPLGEVVNVTTAFLGCKSGTNSNGQTVFEPRNEHKGDAARAIMYQAICYNSISGNNWSLPSTQDQMILKNWHFQDPPDSWEIARNDLIDSIQNNRNPFIDSIDYVCFVNFSNMSYDALACQPSSIEELLNKGFMTYPNPCNNLLNLHVDATTISSYQIIDYLGRIILNKKVNNSTLVKVNISKLPRGIYTVNVVTPFGEAQKNVMIE